MGNQQSHSESSSKKEKNPDSGSTTNSIKQKEGSSTNLSRSASGADIQESNKYSTHLLPIDKLAKILLKKSQTEEHIQGISEGTFQKYVFPRYPVLAEKVFRNFRISAKAKNAFLSLNSFRQQCEKFLGVLDDEVIIEMYVRMYSESNGEDEESTSDQMSCDAFQLLLMTAYRVAMDHYSEGPQMCLVIQKTLNTVVSACFHHKTNLSASYITHWIMQNIPRLLFPLHRYTVHRLATSHRLIEAESGLESNAAGIELATPVLEQPPPFGNQNSHSTRLLPMSRAWLLAGAMPPLYSRPREAPSPVNSCPSTGQNAQRLLSKIIAAVPSHWVQLYCSDSHGRGVNRFLNNVLAYRGPTVCLFGADCGAVFCVAAPTEWHESHLYWGGEECVVLQVYPKFSVIEKNQKMLYLNTTIRGYPQGLRAGKDPRKPIISIDGGFEKMEFQSIPYQLTHIEVWGCGDHQQRERQLDIKKWQVKEAERQRCVKISAADWLDHPDRYLLEIAGVRPQYNNGQTQQQ